MLSELHSALRDFFSTLRYISVASVAHRWRHAPASASKPCSLTRRSTFPTKMMVSHAKMAGSAAKMLLLLA